MTRRSKWVIGLALFAPVRGWADAPVEVAPVDENPQTADSFDNQLPIIQPTTLVPLPDQASGFVSPTLRWVTPRASSSDISTSAKREQSALNSPVPLSPQADGDWVPRIPPASAWASPGRMESPPLITAWSNESLFPWALPASFPAGQNSNRPKSTIQIIVNDSGTTSSISDFAAEDAAGLTVEISPTTSPDGESASARLGRSPLSAADSGAAGTAATGDLGSDSVEETRDRSSKVGTSMPTGELPTLRPETPFDPLEFRRPKFPAASSESTIGSAVRPGQVAGPSGSFIGDLGQGNMNSEVQDLPAEDVRRGAGDAIGIADSERGEFSSDAMADLPSGPEETWGGPEAAKDGPAGDRSGATEGDAKTTVVDLSLNFIGDRITASGELVLSSHVNAPKAELSSRALKLKPVIERGLKYYRDRPEDAAIRTHWGMMHSIMVFDKDTEIIDRQKRYNAVAWMAGNNPCRNQILFSEDANGIVVRIGPGLQGHQGQLLAIFGQIDVPVQYPIYAGKKQFSVRDILRREMQDCNVGDELTFTLIGLAHYADSDTEWVASDGEAWSVERVIREELKQPIVGAACGGTHRLMGFGHALRRRLAEGKPITGEWDRADRFVKDFIDYTWTLQNRDGSMSTAWFEHREDNGKVDRKIQTTGHMLEMLMVVTPDDQLQSPQLLRTVEFLANAMYSERGHTWEVGPKGHALRSLAMYYQRVFRDPTPWRNAPVERSTNRSRPQVRSVR